MKKIEAPAHLEKPEAAIYIRIRADFGITDAGGLSVLLAACESHGRARRCRERIDIDGELVGNRAHPLLATERNSRKDYVLALQTLGLEVEPKNPVGRPPYQNPYAKGSL
jgi:hypothetical protein